MMKLAVVFFSFYLSSFCLAGQTLSKQNLDSLHKALSTAGGITKSDVLMEIAKYYGYKNFDSSTHYALLARNVAIAFQDTKRLAIINRTLGTYYNRISDGVKAEQYLSKALSYVEKDTSERVKIFSELGLSFINRGRYDSALQYLLSATDLAKDGDTYIPYLHSSLGFLYFKVGEYQKAIQHHKLSIEFDENDIVNVSIGLSNIGAAYNALNNFEQAECYFLKAIENCGRGSCNDRTFLVNEFGMGLCKLNQQQIEIARPYFENSLSRAKRIGERRFESECLLNLAKIDLHDGLRRNAIEKLLQAEEIALKIDNLKVLEGIYKVQADIQKSLLNFRLVSGYQQKLLSIKDSIYTRELANRLTTLEVRHVERENKMKAQSQNALLTFQKETIEIQNLMIIAIATAGVLLLTLLFIVWRLLKARNRTNLLLVEKVHQRTAELHERVLQLERFRSQEAHTFLSVLNTVRKDISSLEGLCEISLKEIGDPVITKEVQFRLNKLSNDLNTNLNLVQEKAL